MQLSISCAAEIVGIKSREDLNGQLAVLLAFDDTAERWTVEVRQTQEQFRCKSECLIPKQPLALTAGCIAKMSGLASREDLNGKIAKVLMYVKPADRWCVEVLDTLEQVRLREDCLAPQFTLGSIVELRALESRADLNGKNAKVVGHDQKSGRWLAEVVETQEPVRCKFECIKGPVEKAAEEKTAREEAARKAAAEEAARKAAEEAARKAAEVAAAQKAAAADLAKKTAELAARKAAEDEAKRKAQVAVNAKSQGSAKAKAKAAESKRSAPAKASAPPAKKKR